MKIANPIYDSVFKFMMQDNKVAKLLVSKITGLDIIRLDPRPQESTAQAVGRLTVYRLDYAAKVRAADGTSRLVIIEVQKADFATDIMRFRKYLGEQYANVGNVVQSNRGRRLAKALPILSIYFLGECLRRVKAPVVKVERRYFDAASGEELSGREEFIESLTHDSFVIQIPALKTKRKEELLRVLSVFDQSNRAQDWHILNIREEDFPAVCRPIIRRLQKAIADDDALRGMELEDQVNGQFQDLERRVAEANARTQKILEDSVRVLRKQGLTDIEIETEIGFDPATIQQI